MPKPAPKPTISELVSRGLDGTVAAEIVNHTVRLIQIREEVKTLEAERGYTDQYTGVRHPGLSDQLERLVILHDLTVSGFRLENFTVSMKPGAHSSIDPHLLLAAGVDADTIKSCTVTKTWVSLEIRKDPEKKGHAHVAD